MRPGRPQKDPWRDLHKRAVGRFERPVAEHGTGEQSAAGVAHRTAQRGGPLPRDVRQPAEGLRGGAPPLHDDQGFAGRLGDSAPAHTGEAGTGNDAPLSGQDPPLWTGNLRDPVRRGSPSARTLIGTVEMRIAEKRRRSRRGGG